MKKSRTIRTVGIAALTALAATIGFSGTASAQIEDDLPIIIENVPAAVEILAAELQEAAAVAQETQSAVETSAALGDALVATGSALVEGTEQFGALGGSFGGLTLLNLGLQSALAPIVESIDDPASVGDLLGQDDIDTLLANLAPTIEQTKIFGTSAIVEALRGNLRHTGALGLPGNPAVFGDVLTAAVGPFIYLPAGTNLANASNGAGIVLLIGSAAVDGATAEYVDQVEDGIQPLLSDNSELTEPVISVIQAL